MSANATIPIIPRIPTPIKGHVLGLAIKSIIPPIRRIIIAVLRLLIATRTNSGPIVIRAVITRFLALLSLPGFLDIMYANRIMSATLPSSEGWKEIGPIYIHLDELLRVVPKNITYADSARAIK